MPRAADLALLPQERLALEAIKAESIGWIPLAPGAYLHQGAPADAGAARVIDVVGIPNAGMANLDILWLF